MGERYRPIPVEPGAPEPPDWDVAAEISRYRRQNRLLALVASVATSIALLSMIAVVVMAARLRPAPPPAPQQHAAAPDHVAPPRSAERRQAAEALAQLRLPAFAPLDPPGDEPTTFVAALMPTGIDYPDGVSLKADDQRLRLTGISGIGRNGVCQAADGKRFACGLQARASLSLIIAGARVTCYHDQALPPGADGYLCSANGRDLALAQVKAGYALPARPSVEQLQETLAAAMAAHAGAWNGGWALIPSPIADSDMIP
ncbi:MAG: hypothetical protein P4L82_18785 [Ancalomicrobiaceae bacterium]|nr:hypothetical protein [Ancalomicrobiaceae bacterium]